ncbi:MAG: hypothetical protein IPK17_00345 [Chloroflexi bacterium]|uniref:hypothetical protein n=1 Tax=Candidatus Flexifilum breve TaxID=3140694 RepID=UPI003136749A|nr:hypothetical protein [Chloroflexota bacterium]
MITKNRRKAGLVIFLLGLIVLGAAFIIGNGQISAYNGNSYSFVGAIVGGGLMLGGLASAISPKTSQERRFEKVDQLEKRVAQLERERKNAP